MWIILSFYEVTVLAECKFSFREEQKYIRETFFIVSIKLETCKNRAFIIVIIVFTLEK